MPLEQTTYEDNVLCFTMCFLRQLENIWETSWRFIKTETKISALNEVKRLCIEHYSSTEILEAREVLFELYNFDFLNKPTKHDSGSSKSDLMQDLLCLVSRVLDCELPVFVTDSKRIRTPRSVQTWVLEQSRSDRPITYIQAMARNSLANIEQSQEPQAAQGVQQLLVSVSSQTETETETQNPNSSPRPVMKNKSTEMRRKRGCVVSTQTAVKTRDHYTQMTSLELMTSETKTTLRDDEVTSQCLTTSKDSEVTSQSSGVTSNSERTTEDNGEASQASTTSKHSMMTSQGSTTSRDREVTPTASLSRKYISRNEMVSSDDELTSHHNELTSQDGRSENASDVGEIAVKLRQYDRDTLFGLRDHPLSRVSPVFPEDWVSYTEGSVGRVQRVDAIKQSQADSNSTFWKNPAYVPVHICAPGYVKASEAPGWGNLMTHTQLMSLTMASRNVASRPSIENKEVTSQRETTSQNIDKVTVPPASESTSKNSTVTSKNQVMSQESNVTSQNKTSTDSKVTPQCETTSQRFSVTSSARLLQYSRLELLSQRYEPASLVKPDMPENWNQYFQLNHLPLIKRKGVPGLDLPAQPYRLDYRPADGYVTLDDVTSDEPPLGPSLTKNEPEVTGACSAPHSIVTGERRLVTQYDRTQLLCLQNHPAAQSKPNFPQDWNAYFNFPIVKEKSLSEERHLVQHFSATTRFASVARALSTAPASVSALTPAFVKSASPRPQHIPVPKTVLKALAVNMPDRGGSLSRRTLPVIEPPILHKAERPWLGYMTALKAELANNNDPDLQTEKLFMEVRGILNKLTPQKFNPLLEQMRALEINTEKRMCGVINLIFEKAISEPKFSELYSVLCKTLSSISVPSETTGRNVTFRVKLLARVQHEFEKARYDEEEMQRLQKEIDEARTELEKRLQELGLEEYRRECKRRSTGNMRFIGCLFKQKMLTEKIILQCLVKMLEGSEDDLECFCVLLTTIGKDLDVGEHKEKIDELFKRLQRIVDTKQCSMRTRCLILDVMDLRANNWVQRRTTEEPTTIDSIRREAQGQAAGLGPQHTQNTQNTRPKSPPAQAQSASPEPQHSRSDTPNSETGSWTQVSKPNSKSKKKKKKNK